MRTALALLRTALPLTLTAGLAQAQSLPAKWSPCGDWVVQPDSAAGTTQGNPGPDGEGNLVWNYEYVSTGNETGSSDPWYDEPAAKLVWDPSWFGQPGVWDIADDFGTAVGQSGATHIYRCDASSCWFNYCPIRRWENATGLPITLEIRGELWLGWGGQNGVAGPVDIDVIIAHRAAGMAASTLLYSSTESKPTPGSTAVEHLRLPIDLPPVVAQPGDSILISHRARNSVTQNRWVTRGSNLLFVRSDALLGDPYCFGDGAGTPCPCGNTGSPREGCANSTGSGAELFAHGSTSASQDDLLLACDRLPTSQPALLFVGTSQPGGLNGLAFGDGLRCAGGMVSRLDIQSPEGWCELTWGAGLLARASLVSGDTGYFQVWYRDPVDGPCGSGFNLSNAVEVLLTP